MPGIQIGELLIEQGVLTSAQVAHILKIQRVNHRPFGDLAERLYGIAPKAIEDAWVEQYLRTVGTIDLEDQAIELAALRTLNRRQAWQFHLLPMYQDGQEIAAATSKENLVRAVNFATRKIDDPVYFLIAERHQLREFLMKHYPVPEFIAEFAAQM